MIKIFISEEQTMTRNLFFFRLLLLVQCFNVHGYISDTIIPTPELNGVFNRPKAIVITPDGKYAYVNNLGPVSTSLGSVSVIDIATNSVILTPGLESGFNNPQAIAITPDGAHVYVACASSGSVVVVDTASNTIETNITGFGYTTDIAITPDGQYAILLSDTNLVVISTASNTVVQTLSLGALSSPNAITLSKDGRYAYVGNLFASVQVVDLQTYTILDTPQFVGTFGFIQLVATTPNGKYIYVTNGNFNSVSVIDVASNTIIPTPYLASGFDGPFGIGITPDSSSTYIVNPAGNSVSRIDVATNTILPTPGLASGFDNPQEIVITPNGKYAYVTDVNNNSVTVFFIGLNPPLNFMACKRKNTFLLQADHYNHLTWTAPTTGNPPASYAIYDDAQLTELVAIVPAGECLQYNDHNKSSCLDYTYYIVSVDTAGNTSVPAVATTTNCCC